MPFKVPFILEFGGWRYGLYSNRKIINTHGIKGQVKAYPLTDDIKRFSSLKTVYLGDSKIKVRVEEVKYHKNMVILKFEEFNNINEILSYKDDFIYIDEKDKINLPDDHFFYIRYNRLSSIWYKR